MTLRIKKYFLLVTGACILSGMVAVSQAQVTGTDSLAARTDNSQTNKAVTGTITDIVTKKGATGITVAVTGFSAAITDDNGNFTVKVPSYNATLLVSGEGYQTREIALKGRTKITLALNDQSLTSLSEPLVTPLGSVSRKNTTAAISKYEYNSAWNQPMQITDASLQGRIAGLNAVRRSGTPGAGANLFLRGFTSLFATNKPLVIVDGVLFDANDYGKSIIANNYTDPLTLIDVKDIDNVTVVKDASSIYGTKGANGAILITTTRAQQQATKIDVGVYQGYNFAPQRLPVMGAGDYRTYLSEILQSKGLSSQQIAAQPYMNDDPANPNYARYHYNTDWQRKVMDNSMSRNIYLKVTGGDNIATYGLTVGVLKDEGIINQTDLTRYNTRFNAEFNFSRKLTGTANLSFSYAEQNLKDQGISPKTNPLYLALTKAPFLNDKDVNDKGIESPNLSDKDTLGISNPSVIINTMQAYNKYYRFFGSFGLRYDISRNFTASTIVGITFDKVRENVFVPRKGVADDTLSNAVADSRLGSQVKRLFTVYNDTRLSYNHTFSRIHKLSANLGLRYQKNDAEQDFTLGFNSATDELVSVQNGVTGLRQVGGNTGEWNWMNGYFNTDYGYMNKLFLSFNMAVDGSSRFGKQGKGGLGINGNRFAIMPSIGAAWLISSENFMANSHIDLLKLRATYSITGNDDIGNYTARQTYISQNLLGVQGLVRGGIANTALQWETVKKMNLGLDLSIFNERLSLSVDAYRNNTSNMLVYETLPSTTGFTTVITNSGSMQTRGIDVQLNARIINGRNFKWDAGINAGTYKNEIGEIPGNTFTTDFAGATFLTKKGEAANLFYGYKTNGVFASDAEAAAAGLGKKNADGSISMFKGGDVRFIDVNGDKIINDADRQVIGDPNPDLTGGFSNRFTYKRFSLNVLFTFSKGNDVYNYLRNRLEAVSTTENQLLSVNNRWRFNGQVTNTPKATFGDPMGNSRFSDRWIEDGSYLRLRNISLSYNVPIRDGGFLKSATIYVNGNNLFTVTKYLGYDPEFSANPSIFAQGIDTGLDPIYRNVMAGVRIGL